MTIRWFLALLCLSAATAVAQDWEEIALSGSKGQYHNASSQLGAAEGWEETEAGRKYSPANLVDWDFSTTWAEGDPGDGTGQTVWLEIPPDCRIFNIFSGYGKSRDLYLKNNRPKRIKLSCYAGVSPPGYVTEIAQCFRARKYPGDLYFELKDTFGLQSFPFPVAYQELEDLLRQVRADSRPGDSLSPDPSCLILRLDIVEVYRGTKWNDACISEVFFGSIYVADHRRPRYAGARNIRVDPKNEGRILADLPGKKNAVIYSDPGYVLGLAEISPSLHWATVMRMDAGAGAGRRQTEWLLLDIPNGKVVNREFEKATGISLSGPFFLVQKGGRLILDVSSIEVTLY